jgi:hypothetical protein
MALDNYMASDSGQAEINRVGAGGDDAQRNPQLSKALKECHPYFEHMREQWQQLLDLFEGENLEKYLFKHTRESTASHKQRKRRIAYRNYLEPVVTLHRHYIFSKPVARSPIDRALEAQLREMQQQAPDPSALGVPVEGQPAGPAVAPIGNDGDQPAKQKRPPATISAINERFNVEWEEHFLNDVDRNHTPIDRFMADLTDLLCVFGKMFVLVDMPRLKTELENEAVRQKAGVRPYYIAYTPLEVVNWELDEDGKLVWIRFIEEPPQQTGEFESRDEKIRGMMKEQYSPAGMDASKEQKAAGKRCAQYRTFTRDSWHVHVVRDDRVELIGEGKHDLGEVPVAVFYDKKSPRYSFGAVSRIRAIATLQQAILNLDSLIDESTYQQSISILVMGRQPVRGEEIVISESNVLEVSPTSLPPFFLTPSQAPLQFMEQRVQLLAQEIYRLAKFNGGFGLEAKSTAPTTAAFEFNLTNRTLADLADSLQAGEWECHRLWFKWLRREYSGYIDYPDEFSIQSFMEDLQVITAAGQAIRSPTFRRALEKRTAKKILASEDEQTMRRIEGEIDIIPDRTDTFTGPIFWDPLMQEIYNPAMGGFPIGKVGEILRTAEAQGVDVSSLRPNATMTTENAMIQQETSRQQQALQMEGAAAAVANGGEQPQKDEKGNAKKNDQPGKSQQSKKKDGGKPPRK